MSRGTFAALILFTASTAQAWDAFLRVTSETTFRGSSETSSSSTRAERAEARRRQGQSDGTGNSQGTQCISDDECYGYCELGRCVDYPAKASAPPVRNTPIIVHPANPIDPSFEPDPPAPAPILKCVSTDQCPQGQSCAHGHCLSPPPMPPSSSLLRRGSELYLRERTVQLRQDLALGEGPVISTLATMQGVCAAKLGRAMRARRGALMKVLGDGTDPRWTSRFLDELEALRVQPVSVSVR